MSAGAINKDAIKKLLADNPIPSEQYQYELPFGFAVPVKNGCSVLCRIVLASLVKSFDYSGSLMGISISSVKPYSHTFDASTVKKKKSGSQSPPPHDTQMKNGDNEVLKLIQLHSSLSTPIEYALFHEYLSAALRLSPDEWSKEFDNILQEDDDGEEEVPKLLLCNTSPDDDVCNQWIEFIVSTVVPPLFDHDQSKFMCHHWSSRHATICIMDQLIRSYNENEDEDDDDDDSTDDQKQNSERRMQVEHLGIAHYVQSIMDHCANIFNFIYGKLSSVYKNVNADSTIVIDCDGNENLAAILQLMKAKYLDANPQTPNIQLYFTTSTSSSPSSLSAHKYGARYVQYTQLAPHDFTVDARIRQLKNVYFASLDASQACLVHYVLTEQRTAYIVDNEKLGVLIWYFLRCLSNHTSISNSIHIFLSVGRDSSSDYLDFLDITKIEIYSHDKKSHAEVLRDYGDECIVCVQFKPGGAGVIAFSNSLVEKLQYISEHNENRFIPEDALLDFYRLYEAGNNDAIINFLIAQLALQLFHIGVAEWVDIYDIDLLSLYQHSLSMTRKKTEVGVGAGNESVVSPVSEESGDDDDDEDGDADDEDGDNEAMEEDDDEEEDLDDVDVNAVAAKYLAGGDDDSEEDGTNGGEEQANGTENNESKHFTMLSRATTRKSTSPELSDAESQSDRGLSPVQSVEDDDGDGSQSDDIFELSAVEPLPRQDDGDGDDGDDDQKNNVEQSKVVETENVESSTEVKHTENAENATTETVSNGITPTQTAETRETDEPVASIQQTTATETVQTDTTAAAEADANNATPTTEKRNSTPKKNAAPVRKTPPALNQSKSTDADPDSDQKSAEEHFSEQSVDIDSYTNKMTLEQRTEILNAKKKKGTQTKRKQSISVLKMQENFQKQLKSRDATATATPTKTTQPSSIVTMIGGTHGAHSTLSLRQRALLAFQSKLTNQQKWKPPTPVTASRPLKTQKSDALMQRIAKYSQNTSALHEEESWRKKLDERNAKNKAIDSPSHSRSNTAGIETTTNSKPLPILTDIILENDVDDVAPRMLSKRTSSSVSQQAIIARLASSGYDWRKKYQKNEGDAILQSLQLRKTEAASTPTSTARARFEQGNWRQKLPSSTPNGASKPKKVKFEPPKQELESKENDDSHDKHAVVNWRVKQKAKKQTAKKRNVHAVVNATMDRFLQVARQQQQQRMSVSVWKQRLQKESDARHDHLLLLHVQIRKLDGKKHDLSNMELALEEQLSEYQQELLQVQTRFETQVAYRHANSQKDAVRSSESDTLSLAAMETRDADQANKMRESMQQKANEREQKLENDTELLADMNRDNCLNVLRQVQILTADDTCLNMSHCWRMQVADADAMMKQMMRYCVEDNARLVSIQFGNTRLDDAWFANDMMPSIAEHATMLTELALEANPLTDASILKLADFVSSNPPCLRVLKFQTLYTDIRTPTITRFLQALEKNTQIIKVVMDIRSEEHREQLQSTLDRNWKRYAQEKRLKKTLMAQIQNRKTKTKGKAK